MTRSARRGAWSPEEDGTLMALIKSQGPNNWVRISQQIERRTPKQCRERFHQNLKPTLRHDPISHEEGVEIERMVAEIGKRWADIARQLGNRSDNAVKNWWNGSMNRRKRNPGQVSAGFKHVGPRLQPISFTSAREQRPYTRVQPPDHHHQSALDTHRIVPDAWSTGQAAPRQIYQPLHHNVPVAADTPGPRKASNGSLSTLHTQYSSRRPSFYSPPHTATPLQARPLDLPRPELPPLRATATNLMPLIERRGSALDRPPLISPALSDTSQSGISSMRYPPSLVSDNQSIYSISPRTMPSPRMTYTATTLQTDFGLRPYRELSGVSVTTLSSPGSVLVGSSQDHRSAGSTSNGHQTVQSSMHDQATGSPTTAVKDARMHLTSLLH